MKITTYALSALAILTLGGAAAPETAMAGGTWHWTDGYDGQLDLDRMKERVEAHRENASEEGRPWRPENATDATDATNPWDGLSLSDLWGHFLIYWQGSF